VVYGINPESKLAYFASSTRALRTKLTPRRRPDQYHTCNNLSGLSVAQHRVVHSTSLVEENRKKFDMSKGLPAVKPTKPEGGWASEEERQDIRRQVWGSALGWVEEGEAVVLGGKESRVVSYPLDSSPRIVAELAEYHIACFQHTTVEVETVHQLFLRPIRMIEIRLDQRLVVESCVGYGPCNTVCI
jgi:hypothetical protein